MYSMGAYVSRCLVVKMQHRRGDLCKAQVDAGAATHGFSRQRVNLLLTALAACSYCKDRPLLQLDRSPTGVS